MANRSNIADEAASLFGSARGAAEAAYETGRRAIERADERIDDLGRFGQERPLLAMGIAFAAGYLVARIIRR